MRGMSQSRVVLAVFDVPPNNNFTVLASKLQWLAIASFKSFTFKVLHQGGNISLEVSWEGQ